MTNRPQTYEEWLKWIYSFYRAGRASPPVRASREFALRALGRDFQRSGNCIQITGTNGKGSTASWAEELVLQRTSKVVCATSPHLYSVRERIRVGGKVLSKTEFASLLESIYSIICEMTADGFEPTPFQIVVWAAFAAQKQLGGDSVGIYEVGAGGGSDSTNIFESGKVGLTRISDDHLHDFGGTIESVAREKLALCTKGKTLYYQPQSQVVQEIIDHQATMRGIAAHEIRASERQYRFEHKWQLANYFLARAVSQAPAHHVGSQKRVNKRLPCRYQKRRLGSIELILDIAHNLDGIGKLIETVPTNPQLQAAALVGLSANAKWRECMELIIRSGRFHSILVVPYSRAHPMKPSQFATAFREVTPFDSFIEAVEHLLASSSKICFVFGHPAVCGDFERALIMLDLPGSISKDDFDPLQPWMNDSW